MSVTTFEEDPADEGRRRADARMAHLIASAEATTAAEIAAHASTSARLRAGQVGILGAGSPQDNAAAVAERTPLVGSDFGGRPLARDAGLHTHHLSGPHPQAHDLTGVDNVGGLAYDPLASYRQSRGQ